MLSEICGRTENTREPTDAISRLRALANFRESFSLFLNSVMLRSLFTLPLFTRLYATQVPLPHRFAMSQQRESQQQQNSQYITERISGELTTSLFKVGLLQR